jgi:hypothetical protein
VVAPVAGTAGYLAWSWYVFGDALAPYRAQTGRSCAAGILDVDSRFLVRTSDGGYPWPLVLGLLAAAAVLLWVCARRLPASYTVWSVCAVAAAATAYSFTRSALPRLSLPAHHGGGSGLSPPAGLADRAAGLCRRVHLGVVPQPDPAAVP